MLNLPFYIPVIFIAITFGAVYFIYKVSAKPAVAVGLILVWLLLQAILSLAGFYLYTGGLPPRFIFLLAPPIVFITMLFVTPSGRRFLDSCNPAWLNGLHILRIPVEMVLYLLFTQKFIPQIMTFEGHNFDIISGLTAPFIIYFGYYKKQLPKSVMLIWNFVCICLLVNIAVIAVLSGPFVFQKFGFEQPNVALIHFPFIWLPCFVVPAVLFTHLVSIRTLLRSTQVPGGEQQVF